MYHFVQYLYHFIFIYHVNTYCEFSRVLLPICSQRNAQYRRVVKDRTLKDRLTTEPLKDRANDRMDGSFPKVLSIICL